MSPPHAETKWLPDVNPAELVRNRAANAVLRIAVYGSYFAYILTPLFSNHEGTYFFLLAVSLNTLFAYTITTKRVMGELFFLTVLLGVCWAALVREHLTPIEDFVAFFCIALAIAPCIVLLSGEHRLH